MVIFEREITSIYREIEKKKTKKIYCLCTTSLTRPMFKSVYI